MTRARTSARTSAHAPVTWPLTIYVDYGCPLCAAEMETLSALDVAGRMTMVDIAGIPLDDACRVAKLTVDDLMSAIHARDAAGLASIATLFGHRWSRPFWDWVYPWIARHRQALSQLGLQHFFKLLARPWLAGRARRAADNGVGCLRAACRITDEPD